MHKTAFRVGDELLAAEGKEEGARSCTGAIVSLTPDRMIVAVQGFGLAVRCGTTIYLREPSDSSLTAWASVRQVSFAGDVKLFDLSDVRYEGADFPRQAQFPARLDPSKHADAEAVGTVTQLNHQGMRVIWQSQLPSQTPVNILVDLPEGILEARCALTGPLLELNSQCQTDLGFVRFYRGYEHVVTLCDTTTPSRRAA